MSAVWNLRPPPVLTPFSLQPHELIAISFSLQPGRYRHDQFWGPEEVLDSPEWQFMVVTFGWAAKPALLVHGINGFCAKVGVGPLAWHQHIDVVNIKVANRVLDLLRGRRGEGGVVTKLSKVADRPTIIAELVRARREAAAEVADSSGDEATPSTSGSGMDRGEGSGGAGTCQEAPAAGKRKRKHKNRKNYGNRLERIHKSYKNGTWWLRALDIMGAMDLAG